MLNQRKWEILGFISAEKPIEEIDPPLSGTEVRYYKEHKEQYEKIKPNLPKGVKFQFVPPNDMDYDESNEPWPPVYD